MDFFGRKLTPKEFEAKREYALKQNEYVHNRIWVAKICEMESNDFWDLAIGFIENDFSIIQECLKHHDVKAGISRHLENVGDITTPMLKQVVTRLRELLCEAMGIETLPDMAAEKPLKDEASKVNQSEFMQYLKIKNTKAYKALNKALNKWVIYDNGVFDFRCSKGSVGLFFLTANITKQEDREIIVKYITIFGEKTTARSLKNAYGNTPTEDWEKMEKEIFNTAGYL
jgi:hypothetical protein